MDRYHKSYRIPKKTPDQALNAMEQKRYSGFFRGLFFGRSCRSDFLEFSANFDVEDWKMTLEELRLGYSNLWDQTWNFSKQSVETGKLQHSHSAVSLFPSIFITTSLAASCFHWV